MPTVAEMIRLLDLEPHPDGGHFRETFRDPRPVDGRRAASSEILREESPIRHGRDRSWLFGKNDIDAR